MRSPGVFMRWADVFMRRTDVFMRRADVFIRWADVFIRSPGVVRRGAGVFMRRAGRRGGRQGIKKTGSGLSGGAENGAAPVVCWDHGGGGYGRRAALGRGGPRRVRENAEGGGGALPLVGGALPLVGGAFPLVGGAFPLVGGALPYVVERLLSAELYAVVLVVGVGHAAFRHLRVLHTGRGSQQGGWLYGQGEGGGLDIGLFHSKINQL